MKSHIIITHVTSNHSFDIKFDSRLIVCPFRPPGELLQLALDDTRDGVLVFSSGHDGIVKERPFPL